jgi:hypothetical protein
MTILQVVAGYICLTFGIVSVTRNLVDVIRGVRSKSWPAVDGVVTKSRVDVKDWFDDEHNSPATVWVTWLP